VLGWAQSIVVAGALATPDDDGAEDAGAGEVV